MHPRAAADVQKSFASNGLSLGEPFQSLDRLREARLVDERGVVRPVLSELEMRRQVPRHAMISS